jgi:DNA-binding NtrC family response regulator
MILLVEDEPIARCAFAQTLSEAGYQVIQASDGEEALRLLYEYRADLVITDLVMPKVNGFKLVDQIRNKWPKTKIILISAYLNREAAHLILEGKVEFLAKPIDSNEMIAIVNRLIFKPAQWQ